MGWGLLLVYINKTYIADAVDTGCGGKVVYGRCTGRRARY